MNFTSKSDSVGILFLIQDIHLSQWYGYDSNYCCTILAIIKEATLDIQLPSDGNSDDDSIFGGRIDAYEAYWLYVDGVR